MLGWLRRWWWAEQVPPMPPNSDLDWPDETEWVFDYDAWKWKSRVKTTNPFNNGWEDDWEDVEENRPVLLVDEPQCCGGQCKLPPPLPPPDSPVWGTGPVDVGSNGPVTMIQTEVQPVLAVLEAETSPSSTSPPIIVSR